MNGRHHPGTIGSPESGGSCDTTPPLLFVSAAPHLRGNESVSRLMLWTLLAIVPAVAAASWHFGWRGLATVALSAAAAVATEWGAAFLARERHPPAPSTACITGTLLALSLPGGLPLWMAPVGSVFAIALVTLAFGGPGRNFLNPALAGRAFLALAFPVAFGASAGGEAIPVPSAAGDISQTALAFCIGFRGGWMGGSSVIALLAGALFLWRLRIIDAALPLSFIGSAFLFFWCANGSDAFFSSETAVGSFARILSIGVPLGAFFMATDPVTSPVTPRARLLFGIGCGALTFLFGTTGNGNDAVMNAVLLMNLAVPYCNRYLMHKPFGAVKTAIAPDAPPEASRRPEAAEPAAAHVPGCKQGAGTRQRD